MVTIRGAGRGVFWFSAGTVMGTYAGFPIVTAVRALVHPRPVRADDVTPSLTVVIAAHNEERGIGDKLRSVLDCDYPPELRDVVVVSDGSTDRTVEVARGFADHGVIALELPRVGKAAALNAARSSCHKSIVVFSDANNPLDTFALRRLVRPFADPQVGGVAGDQRYSNAAGGAEGERSYWAMDRAVKLAESAAGSVVSATGALYAVRRELFPEVVDGVTDDFWISTNVVREGRRLVHAPDAVVHEIPAPRAGLEFHRKVRVMTRGLHGVVRRRELLDPRVHGYYSVQLLCHKLLRRVMVVPILAMWLSSLVAARGGGTFWKLAAAAQSALYTAGVLGLRWRPPGPAGRLLTVGGYFIMVNAASAVAMWNVLRGRRITTWEPVRSAGDSS